MSRILSEGGWVACKGGACRGLLAVERVSRGGVVYVTVVRVCGRQLAMADTHSIHLEHTIKRHRVEGHEIEDSISRAYSAFMQLEDKTEGRSQLDLSKALLQYIKRCFLCPMLAMEKVFLDNTQTLVGLLQALKDDGNFNQKKIDNMLAQVNELHAEISTAKYNASAGSVAWPTKNRRMDVSIVTRMTSTIDDETVFHTYLTGLSCADPLPCLFDFLRFYYKMDENIEKDIIAYFVGKNLCFKVGPMGSAARGNARGKQVLSYLCTASAADEHTPESLHVLVLFPDPPNNPTVKPCASLSLSYRRPEVVLTQLDIPVEATMRQVREVIRGLSMNYDMQVFQEDDEADSSSSSSEGSDDDLEESDINGGFVHGSYHHRGRHDRQRAPLWVKKLHKKEENDVIENIPHILAAVNQYESYHFLHRGELIDHEEEPRVSAIEVAIDEGSNRIVGGQQTEDLVLLLAITGEEDGAG